MKGGEPHGQQQKAQRTCGRGTLDHFSLHVYAQATMVAVFCTNYYAGNCAYYECFSANQEMIKAANDIAAEIAIPIHSR